MAYSTLSPFNSLIRSFSLPLQFNEYPSTRWCGVREAVVGYVRSRLDQVELLVSPRTNVQKRVMDATRFPKDVAKLVGEYCLEHSPENDRPRWITMCMDVAKSDAFQSVTAAAAVAGAGASASAAALAVIGDDAVGIVATSGLAAYHLYRRKSNVVEVSSAAIVTLAKAFGVGIKGAEVAAVVGPVALQAVIDVIACVRAGRGASQTAQWVSQEGKVSLRSACAVTAVTAIAPMGRIMEAQAVAMLVMVNAARQVCRARKAATGKESDGKIWGYAIPPVVILTFANGGVQLATGSPIPPLAFIATNAVAAGSLAAYRLRSTGAHA